MAIIDEKSQIYYDIKPKVVPKGRISQIIIRPVAVLPFEASTEYILCVFGMEYGDVKEYRQKPRDGSLILEHEFMHEQEYTVAINKVANDMVIEKVSIIYLYCVEQDLYRLRPYKGDFHLHSGYSDGRESPAAVCAFSRQQGLDFMAVTDHRLYQPSIEAIDAYKGVPLDLRIFPGEEVHFHKGGHIIAFGGKFGLSETYNSEYVETQEYKNELTAFRCSIDNEIQELPDNIPVDEYVSWRFAIDKVRKAGGLAILCHPYWITRENKYHLTGDYFDYLYKNKVFDAFELMNGENGDTNALQIAYFHQQRANGINVPIVSGTDAHTCVNNPYFIKFFTVVFAEELSIDSISNAVKEGRSVVVNNLTYKEAMAYGDFRLVRYTLYLVREVFPLHDECCYEEGRMMLRYLAKEEGAAEMLTMFKGRTKSLYRNIFGNNE